MIKGKKNQVKRIKQHEYFEEFDCKVENTELYFLVNIKQDKTINLFYKTFSVPERLVEKAGQFDQLIKNLEGE